MKNKAKLLIYILLINTFLFSHLPQVIAQEKFNISTGFGLPELFNVGVYYQLDQTQIGLNVGVYPSKLFENLSVISISTDVRYHFGGFSELSNRRPWYGRLGLSFVRTEIEDTSGISPPILNTRIGRDFNLSKKIGISTDAGALFFINQKVSSEYPVLPCFGIGLFYRI